MRRLPHDIWRNKNLKKNVECRDTTTKSNSKKMDYNYIVEDIIHIMAKHGATHEDAEKIAFLFMKVIKRQKVVDV